MRRNKYRWVALIVASIIMAQFVLRPSRVDAYGNIGQIVKVTSSSYNVRSGPSDNEVSYGQVVANSYFSILDVVTNAGKVWYKIPYRGTTAYLAANTSSQMVFDTKGPFVANVKKQAQVTDRAFEQSISGFPESYRPALRALHTQYPQWRFEPAPVSDPWNVAIDKQMASKSSNTAQYFDGQPYYDRYLYLIRDWTLVDEGSNFAANRAGISFFMDPRNFLNETDIFQFEKLTFSAGFHTETGVRAVAGGNATLQSLAPAFMEAARQTGVSPYFLMSRAKQEVSDSNGTIINSARGDIDLAWPPLFHGDTSISFLTPDKQLAQLERYRSLGHRLNAAQQTAYDDLNKYFRWNTLESRLKAGSALTPAEKKEIELYRATQPLPIAAPVDRYFNLFNIQATPSLGVVDGNRINGVIFASGHKREGDTLVPLSADTLRQYSLPWTSFEAGAIGGAKYIGQGYILQGQDTLYHQKFNVNGPTWHQYMSNLTAPYSEGRHVSTAYKNLGLMNYPHVFKIPVFSDMPEDTAIPPHVSLNISNIPGDIPGSEMPLLDPEEVETKPIDTPQAPLDPSGNKIRFGDINGDSRVDSADRLMLTRHILQMKKLEGTALDYSDINRDGKSDAADRLIITRYLLGLGDLP